MGNTMSHIDDSSLIGQYYGDTALVGALAAFGIRKSPHVRRGESDMSILVPELGLAFTLTDERALEVQCRSYPDGALVLTNVFFHVMEKDRHGAYVGDLPLSLSFCFGKTKLTSCLGEPDVVRLDGTVMRFDRPQYSISVRTEDSGPIAIAGIQAASKATIKDGVAP